jgi:hypothetical protein
MAFTAVAFVGAWASAAAFFLRPMAAPASRLVAIAVATSLVVSGASGYVEIFLLFLVFLEPLRGRLLTAALVAAYLLAIPVDLVAPFRPVEMTHSWLGGMRAVTPLAGVGLGQLLRPGLVLVMLYGLILQTLADCGALRWAGQALHRVAGGYATPGFPSNQTAIEDRGNTVEAARQI